MKHNVSEVFENLFIRYPVLTPVKEEIAKAYELLLDCFKNGGSLYVCGNGGSASDSEHITGELMKPFLIDRPLDESTKAKFTERYPEEGEYLFGNLKKALPCHSLCSQMGLYTAYCNDVDPEMVFAQQVYGYGKKGDVLLAISTSGRSSNVLNALKTADVMGLDSIFLTSHKSQPQSGIAGITIAVPADAVHHIQELHLPVYHALCAMLELEFFGA